MLKMYNLSTFALKASSRFCKKKAFTLAEVLITLAIIGIVAALTIPSLMMKSQDQEFIAGWKKACSTLAQATTQIASENSTSGLWTLDDRLSMRNSYMTQLSTIKDCVNGTTDGCSSYTTVSARGMPSNSTVPALILKNGTILSFLSTYNACSAATVGCGQILVDVNGNKPPNLVGRDIFAGYVKNDTFFPYSINSDIHPCSPQTVASSVPTEANYNCSAEYMYNK